MPHDPRAQHHRELQGQVSPNANSPLKLGIEGTCVRDGPVLNLIVEIGQRTGLETPMPFEVIGTCSFLTSPEIKDFEALRGPIPHQFPVHEIARSKMEVFFQSSTIIREDLIFVEKN